MSLEPSLLVRDLKVVTTQGEVVIVDEVNFGVHAGEVLALVGESGSGKTTIALALLAHARRGLRIAGGEVHLRGKDLLRLDRPELRALRGADIAYVPQDPSSALNPAHRVGRQVLEAMEIHSERIQDPRARVAELVDQVGLGAAPELLDRFPHELSGGQQQRIAIAMAFACRPGVIVLDEPTTGLDVTTQRLVLATIQDLCSAYSVAAVYVSHDLAVVSELASGVAVIYGGRVVELGPTEQVLGLPVHPYTRGLLSSVPSVRRAELLSGIPGQPPRPGGRPAGCAFAPRCELREEACMLSPPPPVPFRQRFVRCIRAETSADRSVRHGRQTPQSAREESAPIIVARELSASFGSTRVLHEVDLELHRQECLAIVGESGAGKTTLAQCLVGLHGNRTGEVLLDGKSIAAEARRRNREDLRRIQYIFQNPYLALNPRKTVGQILADALRQFFSLSGDQVQMRVRQAVDDVALGPGYLARYPDQLSGGERQRVAIARALIVDPEVLVCDEVTSALDVSVQATIIELLRRLQHEHRLAIVFITHNLALVRSIAQSCTVLFRGRVVERGDVGSVLDRPSDEYTTQLLADVPSIRFEHV